MPPRFEEKAFGSSTIQEKAFGCSTVRQFDNSRKSVRLFGKFKKKRSAVPAPDRAAGRSRRFGWTWQLRIMNIEC
jgi:hypothetical protein